MPERPTQELLWVQEWVETEAGWGRRPDGYTLHVRREAIDEFLQSMRQREAEKGFGAGNPPPEYIYPDGDPYQTLITDPELIKSVHESTWGGRWGPGRKAPPPYKET